METLKIKLFKTHNDTPDTLDVSLDDVAEFIAGYIISHEMSYDKSSKTSCIPYGLDMVELVDEILEDQELVYDDSDPNRLEDENFQPDLNVLKFNDEDVKNLKSKILRIFKIGEDVDDNIDINAIVKKWERWYSDSINSDRIPGVRILEETPSSRIDYIEGFDKDGHIIWDDPDWNDDDDYDEDEDYWDEEEYI